MPPLATPSSQHIFARFSARSLSQSSLVAHTSVTSRLEVHEQSLEETSEENRRTAYLRPHSNRNMSMPTLEKNGAAKSSVEPVNGSTTYQRSGFYDNVDGDLGGDDASLSAASQDTDEAALARLGYKSEMMREFGNLSTFSFAFSIMGMCSSIATTFNTPLLYGGGPASVVWCWLIGSIFNVTLGASVAEIVSAYPTSGGVYTVSWRRIRSLSSGSFVASYRLQPVSFPGNTEPCKSISCRRRRTQLI